VAHTARIRQVLVKFEPSQEQTVKVGSGFEPI
jgi:hypothetical protein